MQPDVPQRSFPDDRGLPPVTPPSGRFIVQLFLVPSLIVVIAMLFLLGVHVLFNNGHTPEQFLSQLDSRNDDIRWRGASDLAQVLERKESVLRTNVKFALDLCDRLRVAINDLSAAEKATAEQIKNMRDENKQQQWGRIDSKRNAVRFLSSALADFSMPVGVPLLCELAQRDDSPDVRGNTHLRRTAVFALGNLGENMKEFARLTAPQQSDILNNLKKEAAGTTERAAWARTALHYLKKDAASQTPAEGVVLVDHALAKCAQAEDRELRGYVAGVLRYWDGDMVEPTLLLLARDDGHGTLIGQGADE